MFRIGIRTLMETQNEEETEVERVINRSLRDNSNPLELPSTIFKQHFRVNKDVYNYLLDLLRSSLPEGGKAFAVPTHVKLTACLRFFAEGAYQKAVGRDKEVGMAQSTFSKVLSEVLEVLEQKLCPRWIKWPTKEEELLIAQSFYSQHRIPGVIGCVDGTHIAIIPPRTNKHLYYNRKGFHSLNVMIVCDNNLVIRSIVAKHPGSTHDSRVWSTSQCREVLRSRFAAGESNFWVLGDAGYPLEPWLVTPFRSPQPASSEQNFNDVHSKCRNVVERTIGVLKNRWRCLLVARQLHYCPTKAAKITNVCAALHNVCISFNSEFEAAGEVSERTVEMQFEEPSETSSSFSDAARRIRSNIATSL